jgi:sugar phosphate isomerase/epimerase
VKIGVSTYSFVRDLSTGKRSVLDIIRWTADHGGSHVELVPFGYTVRDNPELIDQIRQTADACHIALSNYLIAADFTSPDESQYRAEIDRVLREVDTAAQLGVPLMRHDVASAALDRPGVRWPSPAIAIERFEALAPRLAQACAEIADYAAQYRIVTSIENHAFLIQASDRVQRLVQLVDRPNFRTTLDMGNFLCVDESPVVGVTKNLTYAEMIHLKDFYVRPATRGLGEGWFPTAYGHCLRGAIFGHGDIDVVEIFRIIKAQHYTGYASIEFEGLEDAEWGTRVGLEYALALWQQA